MTDHYIEPKELRKWVQDHPWGLALSTRAKKVCIRNGFNTVEELRAAVVRGDFLPLYYCKFRDCGEKTGREIYDFTGLPVPTYVPGHYSVA